MFLTTATAPSAKTSTQRPISQRFIARGLYECAAGRWARINTLPRTAR
jgi:hypothetical protein